MICEDPFVKEENNELIVVMGANNVLDERKAVEEFVKRTELELCKFKIAIEHKVPNKITLLPPLINKDMQSRILKEKLKRLKKMYKKLFGKYNKVAVRHIDQNEDIEMEGVHPTKDGTRVFLIWG